MSHTSKSIPATPFNQSWHSLKVTCLDHCNVSDDILQVYLLVFGIVVSLYISGMPPCHFQPQKYAVSNYYINNDQ